MTVRGGRARCFADGEGVVGVRLIPDQDIKLQGARSRRQDGNALPSVDEWESA